MTDRIDIADITDEEIATLETCKSATEWNKTCDAIKEARRGYCPRDWWPKVQESGLANRVAQEWERK